MRIYRYTYNPSDRKKALDLIEAGETISAAARAVNVGVNTVKNWYHESKGWKKRRAPPKSTRAKIERERHALASKLMKRRNLAMKYPSTTKELQDIVANSKVEVKKIPPPYVLGGPKPEWMK